MLLIPDWEWVQRALEIYVANPNCCDIEILEIKHTGDDTAEIIIKGPGVQMLEQPH